MAIYGKRNVIMNTYIPVRICIVVALHLSAAVCREMSLSKGRLFSLLITCTRQPPPASIPLMHAFLADAQNNTPFVSYSCCQSALFLDGCFVLAFLFGKELNLAGGDFLTRRRVHRPVAAFRESSHTYINVCSQPVYF